MDLTDVGLARRRKGSAQVSATGVTQLHVAESGEVWALTTSGDLVRDLLGTPTTLASGVTGPLGFQDLHGKLFIGGLDGERLSVWDRSTLRLTGLAEPAPPTAANTGSGTLFGPRNYRVRYVEVVDGQVVRRSEPSDTLTFTPSGSGAGVQITKPAAIDEGETHWEVCASVGIVGFDFYVIARLPVGTTTYTDTLPWGVSYVAVVGAVLDEPIGAYSLLPDATFLEANHDRLVLAAGSRVMWTPNALDPGDGDDERLDLTTDPFLDLDTLVGGDITALSSPAHDYIWIFKTEGVYQLVRTGVSTRAYRADLITRHRGAVSGSVVTAIDVDGYPAVFFIDLTDGPHIISREGIQWIGPDIETSFDWSSLVAGVFDSDYRRLIWTTGTLSRVLHLDRLDIASRRGGWVRWTHPATATLVASDDGVLAGGPAGVRQLNTNTLDDAGMAFDAVIEPRPITAGPLTTKFGILKGSIVTDGDDQAVRIGVRQNFEDHDQLSIDVASQQPVVSIDNLTISDVETLHLTIGDGAPLTQWAVQQVHLRPTGGTQ